MQTKNQNRIRRRSKKNKRRDEEGRGHTDRWTRSFRGRAGGRDIGGLVKEEVVVGVAAAECLADLGVASQLGVEAIEGPEAVGAEGEAPVGLCFLAPLPHLVDVLPLRLVPLPRVLHHPQDQILREFHHEPHPVLLDPFLTLPLPATDVDSDRVFFSFQPSAILERQASASILHVSEKTNPNHRRHVLSRG